MRLIDADRLKKVIDINMVNQEIKSMFNQYVDMQPTSNNWIPVSERLPEDNERVLVVISNGIKFNCRDIARFFYDKFVDEDYEEIEDVIAWMPIPKYKGIDQ